MLNRQKAVQKRARRLADAAAAAMRATGAVAAPGAGMAPAGTCPRAVAVRAPVARSLGVTAAGKGRARVATMLRVAIASAVRPSPIR